MSMQGIFRGMQVQRVQQRINALAEAHHHTAMAFEGNIQSALAAGELVAPEVLHAIRDIRRCYDRCARDLTKVADMLEAFTFDQMGDGYAEL